jgi:tRNA U34 2-thiouridine synthase MnmA/TrmU
VQSTPEGLAPRPPFVGMKFNSMEAALSHYNRYAHHVGFSVRIESSMKSTKDGEKDKSLFVCNKTRKNVELSPTPVKQRNHTITKLADCKAKLRIKRVGARWEVTQFVEKHMHELIEKFALKKYLRSHNKILKEEKKFIDLLHEVNLSSGRIMEIMGELYGTKKNVPYKCQNSQQLHNQTWRRAQNQRHSLFVEIL